MTHEFSEHYDVIVVGAGHAGVEASLASARMGCKTLLATINLEMLAFMPCNPAIGGSAKGIVVREIDALGGEMGRNIDKTYIQMKMLNTGKGPAVRALRAQADKALYSQTMKHTVEQQPRPERCDVPQELWRSCQLVPERERKRQLRARGRQFYGSWSSAEPSCRGVPVCKPGNGRRCQCRYPEVIRLTTDKHGIVSLLWADIIS